MGLIKWVFEPLGEIYEDFKEELKNEYRVELCENEKQELTLPPSNEKANIFRPTDFQQYIGQKKAKDLLTSYMKGTKERGKIFPHTLIYGPAGCGKTTLARIIAHELGYNFSEIISSNVDMLGIALWGMSPDKNSLVFLDEIHAIPRSEVEKIYSAMEDFTFGGLDIRPFSLIGATTELGEILKDRRPFFDRFKIVIELEDYTVDDMVKIISQYKNQVFPVDNIFDPIYEKIAKNSRNTPRTAIRLLEATIYLNNVDKALYNFGIIKDGYTLKDLKVLEYINKNEKGVGVQGLSSYLGTSQENYIYDIEPFLLSNGLIIRTPRGRKITQDGIDKIKELKI